MTETTLGALQEAARAVTPHAHLHDIRLLASQLESSDDVMGDAELFVTTNVTSTARQRDSFLEILSSYEVRAQLWDPEGEDEGQGSDDGDLEFDPDTSGEDGDRVDVDAPPAWNIKATFIATYLIRPGVEAFSEENMKAFTFITGAMAIHPYAREYVQTTTTRLGYPPFTMPLMRRPGDSIGNPDRLIDLETPDGIPRG